MPVTDQRRVSKRRILLWTTLGLALAVLLALAGFAAHISSLMPALFKLNKQCQEEGYYMAEFEFKMLGFAYQLDKGRYVTAISGIRKLHEQLRSRRGLIKVPRFNDKREELEFYLALQNPRTGAFMDDSFPYCTYDPPTQNVLLLLEQLAKATGQPLRLKYPLKYLDDINTPAKLTAFLDDVSNVGWLASRFPQTSFVFARELLAHGAEDSVLVRTRLYTLSPEWKQAILQWFHARQDPETGMWGPKSRGSGKLLTLDLDNTASIAKAFVDPEGNDLYASFPLRYKSEMFASVLKVMSEPLPAEGNLAEWHEWALKMGKGTYLLTRYLWKDASEEHRTAAANLIERYLRIKFEKYYVPKEGAFSYYPGSQHATLDGTSGGIGIFFDLGAFSAERQRRLWGGPEKTCTDLGRRAVAGLTESDFTPIMDLGTVNSVRFYPRAPEAEDYAANAAGLFYPRPTPVLDVVELAPRVRKWLETTSQSMGNWVSREDLSGRLSRTGIGSVPVWKGEIPLAQLNRVLKENQTLTVIGFDALQVPRRRITFDAARPRRFGRLNGRGQSSTPLTRASTHRCKKHTFIRQVEENGL